MDVDGIDNHNWSIITIDPQAALLGGYEINSATNFYYNYIGTKTQLTLTGPNIEAVREEGHLMQFTIDSNNHILVRGVAIKLEENKNTLFISQDPNGMKTRLYFVDNSYGYYRLHLAGPQDPQNLSNYVTKDLIKLSSSTSLIKTNSLYIKDSSYEGNKVVTKSDIPDTSTLLDKGTSSTTVNQVVYNPVEMKKALTVPSIQGPKYTTDNSGTQHPLFELGGTANNISASSSLTFYRNRAGTWDSATIALTLADGLKIGDYVVGVQSWANIPSSYILTNKDGVAKDANGGVHLTTTGPYANSDNSDDFSFNSFRNGKLHSKLTIGPNGLEGGGWCIDNSKILTESSLSTQQWTLTDTGGTATTVNICVK